MTKRMTATTQEVTIDASHNEGRLKAVAGSASDAFNNVVCNQMIDALWTPADATEEAIHNRRSAALHAAMSFEPQDEIEGMMAAQAVGLHNAAMECLRRAMIPGNGGVMVQLQRQAANLSRAYADMVEALDRKRGKSRPQVVRVERVVVQGGGQAIVGAITSNHPGGGEGHASQIEGRPHAPPARLAHDPAIGSGLPPLRSADEERDPVSVTRNEERAMPDARGTQHRAQDG